MTTAALGGEIDVPTLQGKATIDLPEGTQSGKTFRLRGKGVKGVRSSYPGDLYCHVAVETPVKLTNTSANCSRNSTSRSRKAAQAQPERQGVV